MGKTVQLPITRSKRSQPTYAKLLQRVDPRSRAPLVTWKGNLLRPGTTIPESDLWPNGSFPRTPLIIEFAGAENPARGHARHRSGDTVILWSYERSTGKFLELGRVVAQAATWAILLEPLAREAMAREAGFIPPPDIDLIRSRITRVLAAELDLVADMDRLRVLTLVYDEISVRIADWTTPGTPLLTGVLLNDARLT